METMNTAGAVGTESGVGVRRSRVNGTAGGRAKSVNVGVP